MVQQVENSLRELCGVINQTIDTEKIYLFGSYAYGVPHQDSDYDLCVIIPDDGMRTTDAIKKIRKALYPFQSTPLDVIVCKAGDFAARQQGASLERRIAREGVLLHARNAEPRMA